jgi:undecaprenyl-diphosphatase
MSYFEIVILALVQALTEFLPVSSSAHLYIASRFFETGYQGLAFDLDLHLGTLAAVLIYFRKDWAELFGAGLRYRGGTLSAPQTMLFGLALASIPAGLVGFMLSKNPQLVHSFRNDTLIGINLIVFGLALWLAERFGKKSDAPLSVLQMCLIGLAQMLALVPGVSRSGITMTAALLLGLKRENAAKFSFLLAVPATGMAVAKGMLDIFKGEGVGQITAMQFATGALLSFLFGLVVIHFFLSLIRKIGVLPFAVYRIALGGALLLAVI